MFIFLMSAFLTIGSGESDSKGREKEPDAIIDIIAKNDSIAFVEHGKEPGKHVTVVVGQVVRWVNRDSRAHHVLSAASVGGKRLLDTKAIEPGEHKDVLVDIDMYKAAGGKPAGVATLNYGCDSGPYDTGKLELLSAAKRGRSIR